MMSIMLKISAVVVFIIFPLCWYLSTSKTLDTYFGCCYSSGEDKVKKNSFLYRMYGIDTVPNFWFSLTAMDKWNSYLCKLCNTSPENSKKFSLMKKNRLIIYFTKLLVLDHYWEKKENLK